MLTPQAMQQIRTAALEAIKGLPHAALGEGQINEIMALAGSGELSISERLARAATLAVSAVTDYANKPVNYSAANQQEIERMRALRGLSLFGHHRGDLTRVASNAGNDGGDAALSSRGGNEFNALKNGGAVGDTRTGHGTGFSLLDPVNRHVPGFNQAQVASAANFLKGLGASREQINEATKHMVHLQPFRKDIQDIVTRQREIDRRRARGENVDEDQRKLDEHKKKIRAKVPEKDKPHWDKVMKTLRADDRSAVHNKDPNHINTAESHDERRAEVASRGLTKTVDARADADAATRQTQSGDRTISRLGRLAGASQREETSTSGKPNTQAGPAPGTTAPNPEDKKSAPVKQAVNTKKAPNLVA